jgi:hypothetical protein
MLGDIANGLTVDFVVHWKGDGNDDDYDYDNDNGDYATLSARIEELEEENKLLDEMLSSS